MSYKKWERRLIKYGMFVILGMVISMYFMFKINTQYAADNAPGFGPPTPMLLYIQHKEELLLWYDKFVIPFVLPAFLYWFHKFIDARYARRAPAPVQDEGDQA